jgi:hypothetical protein
MDKFENINLIEALRRVMETNTVYYKNDFNIDVDYFRRMAKQGDPSEKTILWYSRPSGTFSETERQVFQSDTSGHNSWRYYAEQSQRDRVLAYAAEIERVDTATGDVFGNLYELDYHKHAERVRKQSVSSSEVTIFFKRGDSQLMDREEFLNKTVYEVPPVLRFRNEPDNPAKLEKLLRSEKEKRGLSCVAADLDYHIRDLQEGRITFEADRIMANLQKLNAPNSADKLRYMTEIDYHFVTFASNDDIDKLKLAIPYISTSVSSEKNQRGMYACVSAEEIAAERGGREWQACKPSVLETLRINAEKSKHQAIAPKKETTKNKGMEM